MSDIEITVCNLIRKTLSEMGIVNRMSDRATVPQNAQLTQSNQRRVSVPSDNERTSKSIET